ncbi:hypothetical protein KAM380_016780 [Aeromonas caviae]|nr:hypothetical protein KAM380_016780 [Aeromonas caviae]
MLTAEGTRPSLRAAAENEPASSTARKIARESLVKAIVSKPDDGEFLWKKIMGLLFENAPGRRVVRRGIVSACEIERRPRGASQHNAAPTFVSGQ